MVCVHHEYARNLFVEIGKGPTERGSHHISLPARKGCFCVLSLLFLVSVGRLVAAIVVSWSPLISLTLPLGPVNLGGAVRMKWGPGGLYGI